MSENIQDPQPEGCGKPMGWAGGVMAFCGVAFAPRCHDCAPAFNAWYKRQRAKS